MIDDCDVGLSTSQLLTPVALAHLSRSDCFIVEILWIHSANLNSVRSSIDGGHFCDCRYMSVYMYRPIKYDYSDLCLMHQIQYRGRVLPEPAAGTYSAPRPSSWIRKGLGGWGLGQEREERAREEKRKGKIGRHLRCSDWQRLRQIHPQVIIKMWVIFCA